MARTRPCPQPRSCGVRQHEIGSRADRECQTRRASGDTRSDGLTNRPMLRRILSDARARHRAELSDIVGDSPDRALEPGSDFLEEYQEEIDGDAEAISRREPVEYLLPTGLAGTRVVYTLNSGGDTHVYGSSDTAKVTAIDLPEGTRVHAFDYGGQGTHTLSDGSQVSSWVWPERVDAEGRQENAGHLLTPEQFALLERADELEGFFNDRYPNEPETSRQVVARMIWHRERAILDHPESPK